ncbi:hypothetical protein [Vibrio hyugaensis]|uniref:Zona pellucida protein alpha n=1 Tax=Vibrio hyugaensis TaxID=1534743 RepID=A0ABQ5Y708_9VIBR|nr:hypothetical protein [Vibrio hyugaensis]GLR05668.1 hypothetical protein GCM10007906_32560 [Vibrio hyugaensis]
MKVKLLSAVIAASFLAGCSSSSSSDSPSEPAGVASVQTFEGEHFDGMAIQGDSGDYNTVAIRGVEGNTVFNVGGELYFTDGDVVKDASGNVVGNIEVRNNELVFVNDKGFVHLSVEDGRLVVEEFKPKVEHPIEPTPEHPIVGTPSNPIEPIPEHPIQGSPINPIEPVPQHPIEGGPVNPIEPMPEHPITGSPSNPVEPVLDTKNAKLTLAETTQDGVWDIQSTEGKVGQLLITDNDNVMLSVDGKSHTFENTHVVKDIQGKVESIALTGSNGNKFYWNKDSGINRVEKQLTKEQRAELKQKVQSLSQEQRQQIKRAIRDRVERS